MGFHVSLGVCNPSVTGLRTSSPKRATLGVPGFGAYKGRFRV